MSPGIELGTSRIEGRALTNCATLAPKIGGGKRTSGEERKERAGGIEVLKKGGKWEKSRNNTIVFGRQNGKRGRGDQEKISERREGQYGKCKMFRSILSGYTRNILYCLLLYPFKIFFLSLLW